ncbi:MAG: CRISPR-associated protein Crm3 [Bradymonadaceae bacterium]|nr:CRISPR-associated protein Crm3 [Lujinxingiaceae bacterium]
MNDRISLAFVPRDGFFCKDGRGWHTSASGRGHALDWPWPSTLLGALRTAWGRDEESHSGQAFSKDDWREKTCDVRLKRTLALRRPVGVSWSPLHRIWPVPADALWLEAREDVYRLDPRPATLPTLGRDEDVAREALWLPVVEHEGKPSTSARWWDDRDLRDWLVGKPVKIKDEGRAVKLSRRGQTRIKLDAATHTADEGNLFSYEVLETLECQEGTNASLEWGIALDATLPSVSDMNIATLGSDSRLAHIESLNEQVFEFPAELGAAFRAGSSGLRVITITPTIFQNGWLPDGFTADNDLFRGRLPHVDFDLILRAAIVPRPLHVSGWDIVAGKPKPVVRAVPAGAVYYFERVDGASFDESSAKSLWLATLGTRADEGFGCIVPGIWNSTRSSL